MIQTVYTNYWINERAQVRKEHGSYFSEDEAVAGIEAWWEIHKDNYKDVQKIRTNTGALEIHYGDPNYYYRVESRQTDRPIPKAKVKERSPGEIDSIRRQYGVDDEAYLFEELAQPYQDRLQTAFHDGEKLKEYTFDKKGRPIKKYNL